MTDNYPQNSQPAYAQPAYDVHAGYGGQDGYGTPQEQRPRGKGMGMTSLILAIAALVIGMVLAIVWSVIMADYVMAAATGAIATTESIPEDALVTAGIVQTGFFLPSLIGVAAIVFGIIAMVKKSGRGLGIFGLILAIVAPLLCFVTSVVVALVAAG